ncbi:TolC family protein [Deferribacterales bacterium Es71-Z0220]|uniref:TolC family protein n=1 Tax=Deferrivibrio essentukiensis TaxID=2880922 RepID=UPI001F608B0A|nr:TolC family protein [Deferrivibrio essentukiensis]MCB4205527.1 TolC family protein [Deferrivibrio essentukiensis]
MYKILSTIIIMFAALNVFALTLDLETAKEMALKNNNIIKAYEEEAKSASYKLNQAKGAYLPKINISETFLSTDEPATAAFAKMAQGKFDFPYFNTQLADPDRVENFETKIELIQPIYMQGKIYFGIMQAKEMDRAYKLTLTRIKENVLLNTIKAFYGKGVAEKAVEAVEKSLTRTKRYYDMTDNFYKNGMVVKSDLLVAESYLLQNEEALISAKKQVNIAESYLQRLLNTDENIQIVWGNLEDYQVNNLDALLEEALKNRSDLQAMEKFANINKYEVSKSKSEFLPEVALFANYKMNDENFMGDSGKGLTAGVMVKFNIFDGFSSTNKIKSSKSNYLSSIHKINDKKLEIKTEVKDAYFTYKASLERLAAMKKQVEAAYRALEITENRFKEGLAKITDLLDREFEVKEAELKLTMAEYDVITNYAELMFATGKIK